MARRMKRAVDTAPDEVPNDSMANPRSGARTVIDDLGAATVGSDGVGSEVGYGRPPVHSRFKPGQSGNPRGRTRQTRNLRTILKQVLGEDVQIREGDRMRRMSRVEALVRTTLGRAFKGDPKAFASLGFLMRQSGYGEDRDEPSAEALLGSNYQEIVADFLKRSLAADTIDGASFPAPVEDPEGGK